VGKGFGKEKE
jgi:hypothetical protein